MLITTKLVVTAIKFPSPTGNGALHNRIGPHSHWLDQASWGPTQPRGIGFWVRKAQEGPMTGTAGRSHFSNGIIINCETD